MTEHETSTAMLVVAEMKRGKALYGPFHSPHEAYGVLAEEMDELLEAIRNNDQEATVKEAIQVSAVAMRMAKELTNGIRKQA